MSRPAVIGSGQTSLDTGAAFAPWRVVELTIDLGHVLPDIEGLAGHAGVFGIVRFLGSPIGYVEAPVTGGRCDGRSLTDAILRGHGDAILRRLLTAALLDGSYARGRGPAALLRATHPPYPGPLQALSIAVCTRGRHEDLTRCLTSLQRLDYPSLDLLVVDNAPPDDQTQRVVSTFHPRVRYVREPCPGLSWARRTAIREAHGDLLAFIDDDVIVDRSWARSVAAVFAEHDDVMIVTGLVAPYELETEPQLAFERHGGFGRGFVRRWFRRRHDEATAPRLGNAATLGIGANMTFRRSIFAEVGDFDRALGAGTPTQGGEDLDMYFRILKAGHTLVYEPAAMVRHRHRRSDAGLHAQLKGWGSGMQCYLIKSMRTYPEERLALGLLNARILLLYHPRRLVHSLAGVGLKPALVLAELSGYLAGLRRFGPARRQAAQLALQYGEPPAAPPVVPSSAGRPSGPPPLIRLDLDRPLPPNLPEADGADHIRLGIHDGGRSLGVVEITSGGHALTKTRVADAVVEEMWRQLLDPIDEYRRTLRAQWTS